MAAKVHHEVVVEVVQGFWAALFQELLFVGGADGATQVPVILLLEGPIQRVVAYLRLHAGFATQWVISPVDV